MKTHQVSWIVDLHNHMQGESKTFVNGFKEAGIFETINYTQAINESKTRLGHNIFSVDCFRFFFLDCTKYYLGSCYFSGTSQYEIWNFTLTCHSDNVIFVRLSFVRLRY